MIKAIIFDFDGVLVESVDIKTMAFAKLFESEGKKIVEKVVDYHLRNTGVSRFEKIKYIYKNMLNRHLSKETFDSLCRQFSHLVVDEVVNAPYVKGAKEFLDDYAKKYSCFVASATPQDEIEDIIKRKQMTGYFKGVYGSPKKKVDIVREILAMPLNSCLVPQSFVYIGDAMSDYLAAKDNKVLFIARVVSDNSRIFKDLDCIKLNDLMNLKEAISSVNCREGESLG
jgi:phosphoglycolate phosphatase-like HAD superfamily hydrolase